MQEKFFRGVARESGELTLIPFVGALCGHYGLNFLKKNFAAAFDE
jgi:hypothetical protein